MAEDEDTTEAAEAPEHDGSTDERLTGLEDAVGRIEAALSKLVPGSHAEAQERTERRLSRGDQAADLAGQTRAEVQKALKEEREREAREAAGREKEEAHALEHAKLREAPPAPPPRPLLARVMTGAWEDKH